jgi:hypothetical protein
MKTIKQFRDKIGSRISRGPQDFIVYDIWNPCNKCLRDVFSSEPINQVWSKVDTQFLQLMLECKISISSFISDDKITQIP